MWMNLTNIILSRKNHIQYDSIYGEFNKIKNETINHLKTQTCTGYPWGGLEGNEIREVQR